MKMVNGFINTTMLHMLCSLLGRRHRQLETFTSHPEPQTQLLSSAYGDTKKFVAMHVCDATSKGLIPHFEFRTFCRSPTLSLKFRLLRRFITCVTSSYESQYSILYALTLRTCIIQSFFFLFDFFITHLLPSSL
jgi:hypothetical protein